MPFFVVFTKENTESERKRIAFLSCLTAFLILCVFAFTGDLLFKEGIGRYDLWGGDGEKLKKSILELYNTIEEDTLVLPGHGEFTTIKYEKRHNPFVNLNT